VTPKLTVISASARPRAAHRAAVKNPMPVSPHSVLNVALNTQEGFGPRSIRLQRSTEKFVIRGGYGSSGPHPADPDVDRVQPERIMFC